MTPSATKSATPRLSFRAPKTKTVRIRPGDFKANNIPYALALLAPLQTRTETRVIKNANPWSTGTDTAERHQ